jgi:hypothetical protein
MKAAVVYTMRAKTAYGFVWKWRSSDFTKRSPLSFISHDDCVADAQRSGYTVAPPRDAAS